MGVSKVSRILRIRSLGRIFVIGSFLLFFIIFLEYTEYHLPHFLQFLIDEISLSSKKKNQRDKLLINTEGCKINYIDIHDTSVIHYFIKKDPIICPNMPLLVHVVQNSLVLNMTIIKKYYKNQFSHCEYRAIHRDHRKLSDNIFDLSSVEYRLDITHQKAEITDEFICLRCYDYWSHVIYENCYPFIIKKKKKQTLFSKHNEKINVILLGLDSVSRLNFIRMCPKTYTLLTKILQAFEFKGYNKVAENTLVNIVPLLAGKFLEELPWDEETMINVTFDQYNFLWQNFSNNGYFTLFAEDHPSIASFNTKKNGFRYQPTDYYLRPFNLAVEKLGFLKNDRCIENKLEINVIFNWIYDFLTTYKNEPHFVFSILTRFTHDYIEDATSIDQPLYDFFRKLIDSSLIHNTILFLFSDHGMRYGDFRRTYVGNMEDRLPLLLIKLPEIFHNKYPQAVTNLNANTLRLTTPFDVHETLKDILNNNYEYSNESSFSRGISLFNHIPDRRTCYNAGILPQWCTCGFKMPVSLHDPLVENAALYLIDFVNRRTKSHRQWCMQLRLSKIFDARQSLAPLHVNKNSSDGADVIIYHLIIICEPGNAWFEGSVKYYPPAYYWAVDGEVIRINLYNYQSQCITVEKIRKYCICR